MKIRNACLLTLALCMSLVYSVFGQDNDQMRVGHCVPQTMRVKLDTLSIVPGTFTLVGADSSQYHLDYLTAELYLVDSTLMGLPLHYRYQVFELDFSRPISHKSISLVEHGIPQVQLPHEHSSMISELVSDELLTTGFISRGVSLGNNQDMSLNSALNLQISGKLSDDVSIIASISDKNIPIQPEGNTEYLSNINNIFLTLLLKDKLKIDAGDIVASSPQDQYLKVNRNLLGMGLCVNSVWNKSSMTNEIGGGVAKGHFIRQTLTPINGVQGPYRLYGENNEMNIVVVAGSERVYMDGKLLRRGQENDYVIDYNTAEITFTPATLMTSEKRLVVEFECTDRHYSRINAYTFNEIKVGKKRPLTLKVNFYQEQDLKNQSIQPELTDHHKLFLSSLGDNEGAACFPSADSVMFSPDRVLYGKKDTIVEGVKYEIYEYSLNDSIQLYNVGFTYMGRQKGSYKLLRSTANGRVFGWVPPVEGVPQGDYEPVLLLTTPKLLQMTTIAIDYRIKPKSFLHTELALSNYDRNTFSHADDRDNVGFAYSIVAGHEQPLGKNDADTVQWRLNTSLQWDFIHRNFHAVESFREVEFARNYNLEQDYSDTRSEQMLQAVVAVTHPQYSRSQYSFNWLSRLGTLNAFRNEFFSQNRWKGLSVDTRTSWLYSIDSVQNSSFVSSQNKISYDIGKVEFGASDLMEHNVFRRMHSDSMRLNSYAFNEAVVFFQNRDSSVYKYNISYKNRVEYAPKDDNLKLNLSIHELNASFSFDRIKNQHFGMRATYRSQQLHDSVGWSKNEHLFVGNLEYSGRFFKNALVLSTYYEMGNGMELKRNYTFIKVAAGQGVYMWKDYNGNGVEEIDEFEVAAFQDKAEYVKVWLMGTDYVPTYNVRLSQSVQIRPSAVWRNKTGLRRFLSRFSDVAMLRSQAKQSTPAFNPFPLHLEDSLLVSHNLSFNNTLSFNNSTSKFSFDFIVQEARNKELLYYGSEYSTLSLQQVVLKSTPHKSVFIQTSYTHQINGNRSEMMLSRSYTILQHVVGTNLQLQFANTYYASLGYTYNDKSKTGSDEYARTHELKGTFSYKLVRRGMLSGTLQYVGIRGVVPSNSPVSYVLLNGLSLGRNAIWGLDFQFSITDYLQVSLQYEGRKSERNKAIHTGGVSLKAHF